MGEQATENAAASSGKRPWVRYVFVLVLIAVGVGVWLLQRSDPELEGWSGNLDAALEQAGRNDQRVLIFFTKTPMNRQDTRMVEEVLRHGDVRVVLDHADFVTVHLSVDRHAGIANRYNVSRTPAFVLLSPEGEVIRTREEYMNTQTLCGEFLGVSVREAREATPGD